MRSLILELGHSSYNTELVHESDVSEFMLSRSRRQPHVNVTNTSADINLTGTKDVDSSH